MHDPLPWPPELADDNSSSGYHWSHCGSNLILDFHGDPVTAGLVVFSDGNHHMALRETLAAFRKVNSAVGEIFYATTPPNVLVQCIERGSLQLGNLTLSRQPNIFIGPAFVLDKLVSLGKVSQHGPFMQSLGNVLLVRKGNPKSVFGIGDLLKDNVRLFISNPETEKASFDVYAQTLLGMARQQGLDIQRMESMLQGDNPGIVFGERIHHRELPQAIYDGQADVALVYYHLALRYVRIFPEWFELIPLAGSQEQPEFHELNLRTIYHVGLVNAEKPGDEKWAQALMDYLFTDRVTTIYQSHGLSRP